MNEISALEEPLVPPRVPGMFFGGELLIEIRRLGAGPGHQGSLIVGES